MWRARARAAEASDREERRHAVEERAVRDLVLATMQDGTVLIAPDGAVAFANEAVARHLASEPTSLDTVLPLALRSAIEESRAGIRSSIELETGVPARWLRASITPAADGATLVVVSDVTERRRLESVRRDFVTNASRAEDAGGQ